MITPSDIKDLQVFANNLGDKGNTHVCYLILKLLAEFERINRLGTEIREVNIIYADGTGEQLWPKKETI